MHLRTIGNIDRAWTVLRKKCKGALKDKEPSSPFLKTVQIFSVPAAAYFHFKVMLDSGCDLDLISLQTIQALGMCEYMHLMQEDVCFCLDGGYLSSIGTITLQWKGKQFRKIFTTTFHVIDSNSFPCQIILGVNTIIKHGILKFTGFSGRRLPIFPKRTKDENREVSERRAERENKAAANNAKVDADIREKEEAARRDKSNGGSSGSKDRR